MRNGIDATGSSFDIPQFPSTIEEPPNAEPQKFYDMLKVVDTPIWEACENHLQLSVTTLLLNIKVENMSEKCFNQVCQLMKEVFPSGNKMTNDFYQTKKLVIDLGLPVHKIDICPNGCMLYRKDDIHRRECKFCGHDRYMRQKKVVKNKQKKEIALKMYYFLITPRLQILYASEMTIEHMRWHAESQIEDGIMNYPRDGEPWKYFDYTHP